MSDHERAAMDILLSGAYVIPKGVSEDAPMPTPLGWAADASVIEHDAAE